MQSNTDDAETLDFNDSWNQLIMDIQRLSDIPLVRLEALFTRLSLNLTETHRLALLENRDSTDNNSILNHAELCDDIGEFYQQYKETLFNARRT